MNTLAENGTNKTGQRSIVVHGKGTDLSNTEALIGRAKRKVISQNLAIHLVDIAKAQENHEKEKSYWNTFHCQNKVVSADGKLHGNYCKNRFCTLCSSIRKADYINRYLPKLSTWEMPHFLTLTIKSCSADQLPSRMDGMIRAIKRITQKYRKRAQRGTDTALVGVRSLECNFNPQRKTYNPHFHIITNNKHTAEVLLKEWLKLWTPKFAKRPAQDIREIWDVESGLVEIIKYGSKIFTEPDLKKKATTNEGNQEIYLAALEHILSCMKGKRIFERFGFNLSKVVKNEHIEPQVKQDFSVWEFDQKVSDWVSPDENSSLTGYTLPSQLDAMLTNKINTSLK